MSARTLSLLTLLVSLAALAGPHVAGASEPEMTQAPTIVLQGSTLVGSNGGWQSNSGSPTKYVFRFTRNGTTVKGPTSMPKTTQGRRLAPGRDVSGRPQRVRLRPPVRRLRAADVRRGLGRNPLHLRLLRRVGRVRRLGAGATTSTARKRGLSDRAGLRAARRPRRPRRRPHLPRPLSRSRRRRSLRRRPPPRDHGRRDGRADR